MVVGVVSSREKLLDKQNVFWFEDSLFREFLYHVSDVLLDCLQGRGLCLLRVEGWRDDIVD